MAAGPWWTPQEDELLRQHFQKMSHEELHNLFPNRSWTSIKIRACRLGMQRNWQIRETGLPLDTSFIGHLTETEKAYLAGIIDGEGCIHMARRKPKGKNSPVYALYVSITNSSPTLKAWLEEKFPGRVYVKTKNNGEEHPHWRKCYEWTLAGNRQVMVFLREIAPYLIIKKKQAEMLMNGYLHLSEEERFSLCQALREEKTRS